MIGCFCELSAATPRHTKQQTRAGEVCLRRTARVGYWCTIVPVWKLLARCYRPDVAAENNGVWWTLVGLSRWLTLISRIVGAADRAGRSRATPPTCFRELGAPVRVVLSATIVNRDSPAGQAYYRTGIVDVAVVSSSAQG